MRATFKNKGSIWLAGAGLLGLVVVVALMLWLMSIMMTGNGTSKNVYKNAYDQANKVKTDVEQRNVHLLDNTPSPTGSRQAPSPGSGQAPSAGSGRAVQPTPAPTDATPLPKTKSAGGHVKVPTQSEDHGVTDMIKEMEH